ncbi:MAG: toll/interleukin-1 receptor domain-containing protein [Candidatus Thorarchaeota archaeon]
MVKIFISHSMKDSQLVRVLVKNLEIYNIEAYIAERDYQPGKQLSQKIMQNIDTSDYFLVVYTFNGKDSHFVREEIGYWMGRRGYNNLIPFVERGINPEAFLCGVEYIEYDPINPGLGIANIVKYIDSQIKMKQKQLKFDVGLGLGIAGLTFLIFYALSKLGEE